MSIVASPINSVLSSDLAKVNDCDLVTSAISGLDGSFEELVRRYQRPISAYVYRMVGNYESALDLTQEIFIKVYNSLRRYRPEFKFSTWIYKIAHNAAWKAALPVTDSTAAFLGTQKCLTPSNPPGQVVPNRLF